MDLLFRFDDGIPAPVRMLILSRGLITWQNGENSPLSSTVSDGGKDGVMPASETFTVNENFGEDNHCIANDSDNCREIANFTQANNDGDVAGDDSGTDDDDGRSNLEEFLSGGNPNIENSPPAAPIALLLW